MISDLKPLLNYPFKGLFSMHFKLSELPLPYMLSVSLISCKNEALKNCTSKSLKGKFPQTTMWIGWVESNFTNSTVEVWADLDNQLKRSDYAKLCMSPSLDVILPEYVISQEDNSPLTLYIDFHNFLNNFSWISIVLLIKFIHKCMHIHPSPNISLSIKEEERYMHFQEK